MSATTLKPAVIDGTTYTAELTISTSRALMLTGPRGGVFWGFENTGVPGWFSVHRVSRRGYGLPDQRVAFRVFLCGDRVVSEADYTRAVAVAVKESKEAQVAYH